MPKPMVQRVVRFTVEQDEELRRRAQEFNVSINAYIVARTMGERFDNGIKGTIEGKRVKE